MRDGLKWTANERACTWGCGLLKSLMHCGVNKNLVLILLDLCRFNVHIKYVAKLNSSHASDRMLH